MAIRKRGLTIEHGALLACGISTIRTIEEFHEWLEDDHPKVIVNTGEGRLLSCTQKNKKVIKLWFTDLVQLLQEELKLICDFARYQANSEILEKPDCEKSIIKTLNLQFRTIHWELCSMHEYSYTDETLMTYESLAKWFIHHKEFEMAAQISPPTLEAYYRLNPPQTKPIPPLMQFSANTPQETQNPDFESDDIPTNLYLAYSVFKEVWNDIPENMRNPTKIQLTEYLQQKGVNVAADIEAIIRLSKPDHVKFGGHGDSSKMKWRPKHQR